MPNIYDIASAIQQPNIVGNLRQGQQYGMQLAQQQQQAQDQSNLRALAPDVIQGNPDAFAQAAAINPQAAQQYQSAGDTQLRRLQGAISYIDQQKTPQAKEAAYQQVVKPYLARFGQEPPATFAEAEPKMEAARAQIAQLGGQQAGLINVPASGAVFDPNTRQVVFQNQASPKLPSEVATLQYLQQHPDLAEFQRKQQAAMHPQKVAAAANINGTAEELLTPDAKRLIATALMHGYSIPLPAFGIGHAGAVAKADALNQIAKQVVDSGMPMEAAVSGMIQGKTGMSGLQNVQTSAAKVNAWENSAAKQADITLELSDKVDRTGIPLFNKWLNAGRQGTGDVDTAQFNNGVNTLAEEYARVMGGGNATQTDSTRQLAHTMLNSAMTKDQFQGVVELMKREMATRRDALKESVKQTRGDIVNTNEGPSGESQKQAKQDFSSLWGG